MAYIRKIRPEIDEALEEGIETGQIIAFLRRATAGQVPESAVRTIGQWAARYGRIKLTNVTLLIAKDEATMAELRAHPKVRPYLRYAISPRVSAIDEARTKELVQILKGLDYWPRIEELE